MSCSNITPPPVNCNDLPTSEDHGKTYAITIDPNDKIVVSIKLQTGEVASSLISVNGVFHDKMDPRPQIQFTIRPIDYHG